MKNNKKFRINFGIPHICRCRHISFELCNTRNIFSCKHFLSIYKLLFFSSEDVFSNWVSPGHSCSFRIRIFLHMQLRS